jgi:hypothetical protein
MHNLAYERLQTKQGFNPLSRTTAIAYAIRRLGHVRRLAFEIL